MLVTTSRHHSLALEETAKQLAQQFQCPWIIRNRLSLSQMRKKYGVKHILIVTEDGLSYDYGTSHPLKFHPGLAFIRIKRLIRDLHDPFLSAIDMKKGDSVLDCTAGLASDAIYFSYVVGETGQVTALESEQSIFVIIKEGLSTYRSDLEVVNEAMRRITVCHADHLQWMKKLPDKSIDFVYFDPMFRQTVEDSDAISPLRGTANVSPLSLEAIEEAQRVARKKVILKERSGSNEFQRLGFSNVIRSYSKVAYGVINL